MIFRLTKQIILTFSLLFVIASSQAQEKADPVFSKFCTNPSMDMTLQIEMRGAHRYLRMELTTLDRKTQTSHSLPLAADTDLKNLTALFTSKNTLAIHGVLSDTRLLLIEGATAQFAYKGAVAELICR